MKLVQLTCFIILITSIFGCTNSPNKVEQSNQNIIPLNENIHLCQIIYAPHPHKKAIKAIGEQRLNRTLSLSFEEMVHVSEAFIPMTQSLVEEIIEEDGSAIEVVGHEVMLGGYEGESIPSVVINTKIKDKTSANSLLKIAAEIGFIYSQDSALVICDYNVNNQFEEVNSVELRDEGNKAFLNENSAPLLFGMMIGAHNSVENLGYSYFKDSNVFSTFVNLNTENKEVMVINDLVTWLYKLSNGEVSLKVTSTPTWIFFPHNNWDKNQQGEGFYDYLDVKDIDNKLMDKRKLFLKTLDDVLSEID